MMMKEWQQGKRKSRMNSCKWRICKSKVIMKYLSVFTWWWWWQRQRCLIHIELLEEKIIGTKIKSFAWLCDYSFTHYCYFNDDPDKANKQIGRPTFPTCNQNHLILLYWLINVCRALTLRMLMTMMATNQGWCKSIDWQIKIIHETRNSCLKL